LHYLPATYPYDNTTVLGTFIFFRTLTSRNTRLRLRYYYYNIIYYYYYVTYGHDIHRYLYTTPIYSVPYRYNVIVVMYYLQSLLRAGRRRINRPLWPAAPRAVAAV